MLGSIKGIVTHKDEKYILIENAGLGYRVYAYGDTLLGSTVGENIHLFLHTHVREDAFDLYGFPSMSELSFFELLITVSGIGPKGALGILSVASVESLKRSIKTNDTGYLTKISGIGKKTAEKIALELRDKITGVVESDVTDNLDAIEALQALGYREHDIREALRGVDPKETTNNKIKEALKHLSNR
ncbi:MAG: Holliday junction branch migration protein RuvA [Candidatus Paceibacterota bacterium]